MAHLWRAWVSKWSVLHNSYFNLSRMLRDSLPGKLAFNITWDIAGQDGQPNWTGYNVAHKPYNDMFPTSVQKLRVVRAIEEAITGIISSTSGGTSDRTSWSRVGQSSVFWNLASFPPTPRESTFSKKSLVFYHPQIHHSDSNTTTGGLNLTSHQRLHF